MLSSDHYLIIFIELNQHDNQLLIKFSLSSNIEQYIFVQNGKQRTVVVGITSYIVPPCGTGFPDVFTGVAGYIPFMQATDESNDLSKRTEG